MREEVVFLSNPLVTINLGVRFLRIMTEGQPRMKCAAGKHPLVVVTTVRDLSC